MVQVTGIKDWHVDALLEDLRDIDRREIIALSNRDPERVIRQSVGYGDVHSYTALDASGQVLALFGIGSPSPIGRVGVPWLLGTVRLKEHSRELIQMSRGFLEIAMARDFDYLTNIVWEENHQSIRYLKAVGFTVDLPLKNPRTGEWYRVFHMKGGVKNV